MSSFLLVLLVLVSLILRVDYMHAFSFIQQRHGGFRDGQRSLQYSRKTNPTSPLLLSTYGVIPKTSSSTSPPVLPKQILDVWGIKPDITKFPGANFPLGTNDDNIPPILEMPNFLSANECLTIKEWAEYAIENGAEECTDYLNYRVNKEICEGGESHEGKTLIDEFSLDENKLSASHKGGFRVRLDNQFVQGMLKERILDVLGMQNREFSFEEAPWFRPTPRTVLVRDQTVVFYEEGNGVPPHVDGRDATLLIYLSDVPDGVGGKTVFPDENYAQLPVQGTALLYRSKHELLHYSEAMAPNHEKWIMQLLLDFNHDYKVGETITDFRTGSSYVWDGK